MPVAGNPVLCSSRPIEGCHQAPHGSLLLRAAGAETDRLVWKSKDGLSAPADFANPIAGNHYDFCVYDNGVLKIGASAPADAERWKPLRRGYRYKDPTATGGVARMLLKTKDDNVAKIVVKGRGAALEAGQVTLPFTGPVRVQAVNSATAQTGICWESTFDSGDFLINEAGLFKAKR